MKSKVHRPSPAMVVASIALFLALGGTTLGYGIGHDSSGSEARRGSKAQPRYVLRSGHIVDTDSSAHDGQFNPASGAARCHHGERLISGGVRLRDSSGVLPGQSASMLDSAPMPRGRKWIVTLNSDLGGGARSAFVVFAYCLSR
jgi:hypothetical protein